MYFIVDFDGTLSVQDTVDRMLERFADPEWKAVEEEWRDGKITAIQCMQKQLRMVRADQVSLEKFFRETKLDAGFLPFYTHVSRFAKVAIVSDGLGHAIKVAMRTAALPEIPVFANKLHFVAEGIDISWPHMNSACTAGNGVCKCVVANELCGGSCVILIGDGKSDACLAGKADVVFAKGSLITFCETNSIPHYKFETFSDVLAEISTWPHEAPMQSINLAS